MLKFFYDQISFGTENICICGPIFPQGELQQVVCSIIFQFYEILYQCTEFLDTVVNEYVQSPNDQPTGVCNDFSLALNDQSVYGILGHPG